MEINKYLTTKVSQKIKLTLIFVLHCASLFPQKVNVDTLLIEYLKKSAPVVLRDSTGSTESIELRYLIFKLIKSKIIADSYEDVVEIIGSPLHMFKRRDGFKVIFYTISPLFKENRGGSDLYVLLLDENNDIVMDVGYIYFIESEDDFFYWISPDLPRYSEEGEKNCPPSFRR